MAAWSDQPTFASLVEVLVDRMAGRLLEGSAETCRELIERADGVGAVQIVALDLSILRAPVSSAEHRLLRGLLCHADDDPGWIGDIRCDRLLASLHVQHGVEDVGVRAAGRSGR